MFMRFRLRVHPSLPVLTRIRGHGILTHSRLQLRTYVIKQLMRAVIKRLGCLVNGLYFHPRLSPFRYVKCHFVSSPRSPPFLQISDISDSFHADQRTKPRQFHLRATFVGGDFTYVILPRSATAVKCDSFKSCPLKPLVQFRQMRPLREP